ncbi:MAG: hypothetical protein N3G80_00835 [Candidatus Micrarchaeota archaeon]|nr:hypothetical protein [Candidatus Micrarchaeota archaeon]
MRAFLLVAIFLLVGCAQTEQMQAEAQQAKISVPESKLNYTATYVIYEDGVQLVKNVWRAGKKMRIELKGGTSSLNIYFIEDKAYSCARSYEGRQLCKDVSQIMQKEYMQAIFEPIDLAGAQRAEDVEIGSTTGKCYMLPSLFFETRKVCLTDSGILAYDEKKAIGKPTTVEYLTELSYEVDPKAFDLNLSR